MNTIIVGRLDTQQRANQLVARLRERGVAAEDISAFYVTAPGQHARFAIGGDHYADESAKSASHGQATGAAVGAAVGLAAGGVAAAIAPPLAPAIIAGVTGVGALAGSVAGAMSTTKTGDESEVVNRQAPSTTRRGGLLVAVRATPDLESSVLELFRSSGAGDIERTSGEWRDGHWADFDPLRPLELVDEPR